MSTPKRLPLFELARQEILRQQAEDYARRRAARHPWLTTEEAAFELGLTEGSIRQLINKGVLRLKPNVKSRRVAAVDVYNYKPRPLKRKAAA